MLEGKFLAIFGLSYGILIAVLSAADASAWTIALAGMIGIVGTALIGQYRSYRSTKHDADVRDDPLLVSRVAELQAKVADLQSQLDDAKGLADRWKALCEAGPKGAEKGQSSGGHA